MSRRASAMVRNPVPAHVRSRMQNHARRVRWEIRSRAKCRSLSTTRAISCRGAALSRFRPVSDRPAWRAAHRGVFRDRDRRRPPRRARNTRSTRQRACCEAPDVEIRGLSAPGETPRGLEAHRKRSWRARQRERYEKGAYSSRTEYADSAGRNNAGRRRRDARKGIDCVRFSNYLEATGFAAAALRSNSSANSAGDTALALSTIVPSSASTVGVALMPSDSPSALVSATGFEHVALPGSWPFIAAVYAALRSFEHHTAAAFLSAPGWMSSGYRT